jgi:hypothetical protein
MQRLLGALALIAQMAAVLVVVVIGLIVAFAYANAFRRQDPSQDTRAVDMHAGRVIGQKINH